MYNQNPQHVLTTLNLATDLMRVDCNGKFSFDSECEECEYYIKQQGSDKKDCLFNILYAIKEDLERNL